MSANDWTSGLIALSNQNSLNANYANISLITIFGDNRLAIYLNGTGNFYLQICGTIKPV